MIEALQSSSSATSEARCKARAPQSRGAASSLSLIALLLITYRLIGPGSLISAHPQYEAAKIWESFSMPYMLHIMHQCLSDVELRSETLLGEDIFLPNA